MIKVTCFGHVRTSLGRDTVEIEADKISTTALIEKIREMGRADPNLGFTKYNTLVIVNGSAYSGASEDRILEDGDEVILLPFSHGG
jgi:molybdopterin converting factor small subunit